MRSLVRVAVLGVAIVVAGCSTAATPTPPAPTAAQSAAPSEVASASPAASASAGASAAASPGASAALACDRPDLKTLTQGKLTIGTDNPAYGPWFAGPAPASNSKWENADPNNGQGLEAATAYLIAAQLGFPKADVVWVQVPFLSAIQPGPKTFDMDLNQVSYSADRAQAVDLSDGYFD
ncbi:MAG TPA: hypothetical protein VEG29_02680, partial [Candidatus Binatia bacterium]|nr:hypothetical protein [Candidatus Binatia bacterium]